MGTADTIQLESLLSELLETIVGHLYVSGILRVGQQAQRPHWTPALTDSV